jgi:hypothetical protein
VFLGVYKRNGEKDKIFLLNKEVTLAKAKAIISVIVCDRLTFKDLKKIVAAEITTQQSKPLEKLGEKPFWIWNTEEHKQEDIRTKGQCCFNHLISLPTKNGQEKPMFDYEKLLYDSLLDNDYSNTLKHTFKHKHLWVKKSAGLGVTEFFLRLMT